MNVRHFLIGVILSRTVLAPVHASPVDEIQLLYPGNNVGAHYVVEFRARGVGGEGHAFVALGQELDNGLTQFYGIAGFYPRGRDGTITVKNILYGPGMVTYVVPDLANSEVFRVDITPEQERLVELNR